MDGLRGTTRAKILTIKKNGNPASARGVDRRVITITSTEKVKIKFVPIKKTKKNQIHFACSICERELRIEETYMIPDSKLAADYEKPDNSVKKHVFALLCGDCSEEKHKACTSQIASGRTKQLTEHKLPIHLVVQLLEKNITDVPTGQPSFADTRYTSYPLNTDLFPSLAQEYDRKENSVC